VCCLSYPTCNSHAQYCHLWPAPLYNIFPHYLINGTIFRKKKLLNTKCVFWLPLQLLSETFLILRRNEQDTIINVYWSSYNEQTSYSRQRLMKLEFVDRFSKNYVSNFMKILSLGVELFDAGERTTRQTDRHDKTNTLFSKFCESGFKRWFEVFKLLQDKEFAVLSRQLLRQKCHACSIVRLSQGLSHPSFRAQRKSHNGNNTATVSFTSDSSSSQLHSTENQHLIKLRK
jgi:hypothetical protein